MWDFIVMFGSFSLLCRLHADWRGGIFGYSSSSSLSPRAAALKSLQKGTCRFVNTIVCLCATAQQCKCRTWLWHQWLMQSVCTLLLVQNQPSWDGLVQNWEGNLRGQVKVWGLNIWSTLLCCNTCPWLCVIVLDVIMLHYNALWKYFSRKSQGIY